MGKRYWIISLIIIAAVIGYRKGALTDSLLGNFLRNRLKANWARWNQVHADTDYGLRDGVPDNWDVLYWGGAKVSYYLDETGTLSGSRAAVIEKSTTSGGAALVQKVIVQSGAQMLASVSAKGNGGALQIQFRNNSRDKWQDGGWTDIVPTTEWESYRLSVDLPPHETEVRFLLRPLYGATAFDSAYLGTEVEGQLRSNLLRNPDFEQDGDDEDPLVWWQSQVKRVDTIPLPPGVLNKRDISYISIADMGAGNYETIKQRAGDLGYQCASIPEMTGWLLALGQSKREPLQELYYRLAIELAPNCPQPYAALAKLYASRFAFKSAADLYHKASELSEGTVLAGRFAFEEGFIHVRYTGRIAEAISALRKAEKVGGWEDGSWYWGVASLYLGIALEEKGLDIEASQSYLRVLNCANCKYHHEEAWQRLESLRRSKIKSTGQP